METTLGAAISAAKDEASEVKTVKVDIFDIPETKAEEYYLFDKNLNLV